MEDKANFPKSRVEIMDGWMERWTDGWMVGKKKEKEGGRKRRWEGGRKNRKDKKIKELIEVVQYSAENSSIKKKMKVRKLSNFPRTEEHIFLDIRTQSAQP